MGQDRRCLPGHDRLEKPLLRLVDVDASYGPIQVLSGVSLEVGAGEIVALLGANAAGKSTTLKCVMGTLKIARRLARTTFGFHRSTRGSHTRRASTPAASAVRRIAPRLPGFSTDSATITRGGSLGTR